MIGTVRFDYQIISGGPVGERKVIATFVEKEKVTLVRISEDGAYPALYTIVEHPEAGELGWALVQQFVRDFT